MEQKEIKGFVREHYGKIAEKGQSCCGGFTNCCGNTAQAKEVSEKIGYSQDDLQQVPEGANLGLGCGNPIALASLKEGEVVLDLGSGAGFDCFLAANRVGSRGKVIGVDMTPEMIRRARENAAKGRYANVEFRLGEIEALPLAASSVDVIISNCVINLSDNKAKVFSEAFRVLHPGGRLMVSDIVLMNVLPESVRRSVTAYVGCVSGALPYQEYLGAISAAGFQEVSILEQNTFPLDCIIDDGSGQAIIDGFVLSKEELEKAQGAIVSVKVQAYKPISA